MPEASSGIVTDVNDRRSIFAASIMAGGGAMCFVSFPLFIGEAMSGLGLGSERAGLIFSSYLAGFTIICLSAVAWMRRIDWRLIAILAYSTLALGLLGAAFETGFEFLLAAFFVAGCGSGTLYGLSICMIGDTHEPDRYFGIKVFGEQTVGVILVFSLPLTVQPLWGFDGLCVATAIVAAVLSATVSWVPRRGSKNPESVAANDSAGTRSPTILLPVGLGVLAMLLFFGGLTVVWTFVERIGDSRGLSPATIGTALSFAAIGGGLGGLAAAILGDRFGRFRPLILGFVCTAAVYVVYNLEFGAFLFIAASFVYVFAWNLCLAYQFGMVSSADVSGRYAVLMSSALALGGSFGAAIGGLVFDDGKYVTLSLVSLGIVAVSLAIFAWLLGWLRRQGLEFDQAT